MYAYFLCFCVIHVYINSDAIEEFSGKFLQNRLHHICVYSKNMDGKMYKHAYQTKYLTEFQYFHYSK